MTSLARLAASNANNASFIAPSSGKNGKPFSTSENKNKTMMMMPTMMMGNSRQVSSHRGHRRGRGKRARAAGSSASSSSSEEEKKLAIASEFQLSPLEPSSAVGTHLKKVLERDPNRFEEELDKQLRAWVEERELDKNTNAASPSSSSSSSSSSSIGRMNTIDNNKEMNENLSSRPTGSSPTKKKKKKIPSSESTGDSNEEVDIFASGMFSDQAFSRLRKKREVEDALYLCIAKKKAMKGVELTHDFENVRLRRSGLVKRCQVLSSQFLPPGSEDILNKHLIGVLSNVSTNGGLNPENFEKYIPKVVLAHVYQRSAAYGYFLRRVEKRYNVERLFSEKTMALTNDEESETEHNSKKLISPPQSKNGLKRTLNFRAQPRLRKRENDIVHGKTKGRSRKDEFCVVDEAAGTRTCIEPQLYSFKAYIESLDPEVRARAARIESVEARGALERHVEALFGAQASNSNELSERMRELELLITKTSTKRALSKREYEKNPQRKNACEDEEDEEETDARLQTSYFEIETMEMTLDNLKHLVIEACAFGGELAVVEDRFDGIEGGVLNQ
tara:strand:+ start:404 stop:2086 length:1683 start_codon:yes stop_codon:yes gene_type:complete